MPHVKTKYLGQTAEIIAEQREAWFSVHGEFLREREREREKIVVAKFSLSEHNIFYYVPFFKAIFFSSYFTLSRNFYKPY